ncbi:MAG: hypothetical protein HC881_24555 [Leptolyngbyaceae cyanobacterium SL_7_1]|nr:hypothetical protein [Leptolyngbyaceae cyanobacterium SL_7_1]
MKFVRNVVVCHRVGLTACLLSLDGQDAHPTRPLPWLAMLFTQLALPVDRPTLKPDAALLLL